MDRKKLFKRLTFLICLIFLLNSLAAKFYLYSMIWWFDMPMHFMGGFWLGLAFIWLFYPNLFNFSPVFIIKAILSVLLIGILWEFLELYFVNHIAQNPFNLLDTISDLLFDISGGFLAILYVLKKIMLVKETEVQLNQ